MGFWDNLFGRENTKSNTAQKAKDRLKVIVASEQSLSRRLSQEKINEMKREIMQVVNRYMSGVDESHIHMKVHSEANAEMLEMTINFPEER